MHKENADEGDEEKLTHSFFSGRESQPKVPIHLTRRRREPSNCYAPVGDLSKPSIKRLWSDTAIAKTLIPDDYVHLCTLNPIPFNKAHHDASVGVFSLRNTVLVEYNTISTAAHSEFGVFLIFIEQEDIYVREFTRLRIKRCIADYQKNKNNEIDIVPYCLKNVSVMKASKDHRLFYFHQFTYKTHDGSDFKVFYLPIYPS